MNESAVIPVIEIGGSHVAAALVVLTAGIPRVARRQRCPLDSAGSAEDIVAQVAAVAAAVTDGGHSLWGVAIPGPFDYVGGIGRFRDVGKFDSLNGFDLGAALRRSLPGRPGRIVFLNDAEAFARGEFAVGRGAGTRRAVFLTLGSGLGSAFIEDGRPVNTGPQVPPNGWAYRLSYAGRPIEDAVSRRAIRRAYAARTGRDLDVKQIADSARAGDQFAVEAFEGSMTALGTTIAPWLDAFEAQMLVVGGAIAQSWDLLEAPLRRAIVATRPDLERVEVVAAQGTEDIALAGTALAAAEALRHMAPANRDQAGGDQGE